MAKFDESKHPRGDKGQWAKKTTGKDAPTMHPEAPSGVLPAVETAPTVDINQLYERFQQLRPPGATQFSGFDYEEFYDDLRGSEPSEHAVFRIGDDSLAWRRPEDADVSSLPGLILDRGMIARFAALDPRDRRTRLLGLHSAAMEDVYQEYLDSIQDARRANGLVTSDFYLVDEPEGVAYLRLHTDPDVRELAGAAWVTEAAAYATGYPDPRNYGRYEHGLRTNVFQRQARAVSTIVVTDDQAPGNPVVGTAYLQPVQRTTRAARASASMWEKDPELAAQVAAGNVVEVGGLAVHPEYYRRGIATRLVNTLVREAERRNFTVVAEPWGDGPSRDMFAAARGWKQVGSRESVLVHGATLLGFVHRPEAH